MMKKPKESAGLFKNLVEFSNDAIIMLDKLGRFKYVNKKTLEITGYKQKELIGKHFRKIVPAEYLPKCFAMFQKVLRGFRPKPFEIEVRTKRGELMPFGINGSVVKDKGKNIGVQVIARDIIERKKIEEKIRVEKEFSETILNVMPVGLDIVDQDYIIHFMNKTFLDAFGKKAIGKKCYNVYKINKKQCDDCPLKKPIKIGETKTIEVGGIVGNKTFLISHTGILFNEKKHIVETFRDITERKKAEEVLRKSHDELERFYKVAVGRELKMIELKKRIRELESPNSGDQGGRKT